MSKILISQKPSLKAQQGSIIILVVLIILLLIPYVWLGLKVSLMHWKQSVAQGVVNSVATDTSFLNLAHGASDEAIFRELSKNLGLRDISINAKDFSIDQSTKPPVMQIHIHQEMQLAGDLKIVLDDLIKEPIRSANP